jgi:hypothetical protein
MCKFLIDHGAEINRKGGESIATPLQWAAQRCHYYTVNLLLQHGADPLISDAQGYNTLHISTFNGNVLLIVLLLHQGIPVDVLDSYGHTGLMWSAYKGFPQCVDVFLRWGASVHAKDEQGFTALHWALVKGSPACIQKLLEYGSDRFAKTETGKTPALTAKELNTSGAWHRALRECGYDEDAQAIEPHFPGAKYLRQDKKGFVTKFLFLWPFLIVWSLLHLLAGLPILLGLLLTGVIGYALQWCAQQVLDHAPPGMRHFHKTVGDCQLFRFSPDANRASHISPVSLPPRCSSSHGIGSSPCSPTRHLPRVSSPLRRRPASANINSTVQPALVAEHSVRHLRGPLRILLHHQHGPRSWFRSQDERYCRAKSGHRRALEAMEV